MLTAEQSLSTDKLFMSQSKNKKKAEKLSNKFLLFMILAI